MTLHWWQHWFWITAWTRVVLLLCLLPHCLSEEPWVYPVVAVPGPWGAPSWVEAPWANLPPRRLLGFAHPSSVPEVPDDASSPGVTVTTDDLPVDTVVYLSTSPSSSPSQPQRGAKFIGGFPSAPTPTAPPAPPTYRPLPTVPAPVPTRIATMESTTGAVEIVEEPENASRPGPGPPLWTVTPDDAPTGESPTVNRPAADSSPSTDAVGSAEMPNDEPPRAAEEMTSFAASSSPEGSPATLATMASLTSLSSASPQALPLSTAPAPDSSTTEQIPVVHPGAVRANSSFSVFVKKGTFYEPQAGAAAELPADASSRLSATRQHRAGAAVPAVAAVAGVTGQGPSTSGAGGLDAGSITGIVMGIVVFAALVGTVSFVLYRRRYLNKPQTLNDKCSNPDSSGYIDDSTLRENSEEMYSLDNDSFLNSLEAMTIQNYWTDSVKHTKL